MFKCLNFCLIFRIYSRLGQWTSGNCWSLTFYKPDALTTKIVKALNNVNLTKKNRNKNWLTQEMSNTNATGIKVCQALVKPVTVMWRFIVYYNAVLILLLPQPSVTTSSFLELLNLRPSFTKVLSEIVWTKCFRPDAPLLWSLNHIIVRCWN